MHLLLLAAMTVAVANDCTVVMVVMVNSFAVADASASMMDNVEAQTP